MNQAVEQMRKEFGRDAVILNTKRLKQGGFFGLFGKTYFEIIGAVDSDKQEEVAPLRTVKNQKPEFNLENPVNNELKKLEQIIVPDQSSWSEAVQTVYKELTNLGLTHEIAFDLVRIALSDSPGQYWDNPIYLMEQVKIYLADKLAVNESWDFDSERKVVALIGPTGVGKTTTIAKIAAKYQLFSNCNVGLITLDTYRMAAVEQLRTYAEIIDIPLVVAYNLDELEQALETMSDKDLVLVDTAGRSHFNESQMHELGQLLDVLDAETYLTINACTRNEDLAAIVAVYKQFGFDRLIITKLDETQVYGILLQAPLLADAPIAFITTGQSVPDDIEIAEANQLLQLALGE